jgi:hypothetical protein
MEKFFHAFSIRLYYESANYKLEISRLHFSGSLPYRFSAKIVKRFMGYTVKSICTLIKLCLITERCS